MTFHKTSSFSRTSPVLVIDILKFQDCSRFFHNVRTLWTYVDEASQRAEQPVFAVHCVSDGILVVVLGWMTRVWRRRRVPVQDRRLSSWRRWRSITVHLLSTVSSGVWREKKTRRPIRIYSWNRSRRFSTIMTDTRLPKTLRPITVQESGDVTL